MKILPLLLFLLFSCTAKPHKNDEKESVLLAFLAPQKVSIAGYTDDIMEPFLSRNGKYIFFNNLNEPSVNTNIFYAEKINDTVFQYRGEVQGVNSLSLDGVVSIDNNDNFYFVSNRSYSGSLSTIYQGLFRNGHVDSIVIVPGISRQEPWIVNFDVEISADGNTMYFVDSRFNSNGQPESADIVMAVKNAGTFQRMPGAAEILRNVNTDQLEYAVGIADNELTIYFTRIPSIMSNVVPRIYYATRENKMLPFNKPHELTTGEGFVEAATVSGDSLVYYHKKENGHFVLECLKRKG